MLTVKGALPTFPEERGGPDALVDAALAALNRAVN